MKNRVIVMADPKLLKVSPAAQAIPGMANSEFQDLMKDIAERGIVEPLHLAEDGVTILDGRHRHQAALELEKPEVPTIIADLGAMTPDVYAIRCAIMRRQLTLDQRANLVARLADGPIAASLSERGAKAGRSRGGKKAGDSANTGATDTPTLTESPRKRIVDNLAEAYGVPAGAVKKARKLMKKSPELSQAVDRGEETLGSAAAKAGLDGPRDIEEREDDLRLVIPDQIEAGRYYADFLALVRLGYPREVVIVWKLRHTQSMNSDRVFLQRVRDSIMDDARLRCDDPLAVTLTSIFGQGPVVDATGSQSRSCWLTIQCEDGKTTVASIDRGSRDSEKHTSAFKEIGLGSPGDL